MMELKREIGESGCDPSIQVGLSARQHWVKDEAVSFLHIYDGFALWTIALQFGEVRDRCCCPTLMLVGGGPWMAVLGGVLTDIPIVQRLTDMLWIGHSTTHEDSRVQHLARVFLALRESLRELKAFYVNLIDNAEEQPAFDSQKPDMPHPRFYPYAKTFTEGEQTVEFDYLRRLEDDVACVAFLARTREREPRDIVAKFVTDYGEEVHRFLAFHGAS